MKEIEIERKNEIEKTKIEREKEGFHWRIEAQNLIKEFQTPQLVVRNFYSRITSIGKYFQRREEASRKK